MDMLLLSKTFVDLPDSIKEKYVVASASFYAIGWSHGKEKL